MNMKKMQEIDIKIAEHILIISFYEAMLRFIYSLGWSSLPENHAMKDVFANGIENKTISSGVSKTVKTKLENFIKGGKIDRVKLIKLINDQCEKYKSKLDALTSKRNK